MTLYHIIRIIAGTTTVLPGLYTREEAIAYRNALRADGRLYGSTHIRVANVNA